MITDNADELLAAAVAAWQTTGLPVAPNPRVVVGDVALDDCCDGVLVLSIDSLVWWNPFPFEALARGGQGVVVPFAPISPCIGTLGAAATLWVGACIPVLNANGQPPDPATEAEAMATVVDLAQTITTAIACDRDDRWVVGGTTFVGTEAGCLVAQIAARIDG